MAVVIRAVETVHKERHPGRAAFEKGNAEVWEAVEYAVREHSRCLNHQAKWMPQSMGRIVSAEGVEPHMMETAHVHGENAAEFFSFCIKSPVRLVSEMSLNGFAVRRQHAAEHAQFFDGPAQLGNCPVDIL